MHKRALWGLPAKNQSSDSMSFLESFLGVGGKVPEMPYQSREVKVHQVPCGLTQHSFISPLHYIPIVGWRTLFIVVIQGPRRMEAVWWHDHWNRKRKGTANPPSVPKALPWNVTLVISFVNTSHMVCLTSKKVRSVVLPWPEQRGVARYLWTALNSTPLCWSLPLLS